MMYQVCGAYDAIIALAAMNAASEEGLGLG